VRVRRPFFLPALESSLALPVGAAIALVWANTSLLSYEHFAHTLEFSVNDAAMVFFFALAANEVVESMAPGGALHTWRRAALPVIGATGGMVMPALLFVGYVHYAGATGLLRGWAIPCATDIVFSYLVAKAIFRHRHPAVPFLLLLAIADDALGLAVLAVFYPAGELRLSFGALLMGVALCAAYGLRRKDVRSFWPYVLVPGAISWCALYWSGLHPALALVPIVPFFHGRETQKAFDQSLRHAVQVVLFVFGLVNAGVPMLDYGTGTWAVLVGLLAGKPLGIGLAVGVAVAAGFVLPARFAWRDLVVVGCASGIGFTVALFFASAAFPHGAMLNQTKIGALLSVGSGAVALLAAVVLRTGRFALEANAAPLPARRL
jgi:NhaA family Na+:H+ antiporter